jgi:2-deoxy-D-gluconate 3-dehydrogenase
MFDLSSKKAIVTGAAKGIGKALAEALHEHGAEVVLMDRLDIVFNIAEELAISGPKTYAVKVDLNNRSELKKSFQKAVEKLGTLDILVNAAGVLVSYPAEEFPLEEWDKTLEINLTGLFEMCQLAGKVMLKKGSGKIINVASLNSFFGTANLVAYCASKGGVALLTKTLADEWGKRGVYVNALAPGYIETDLSKGLREDPINYPKSLEKIPLGRWGTPEDLKGPVVFLACKASDYITGTLFVIDGGVLAK